MVAICWAEASAAIARVRCPRGTMTGSTVWNVVPSKARAEPTMKAAAKIHSLEATPAVVAASIIRAAIASTIWARRKTRERS